MATQTQPHRGGTQPLWALLLIAAGAVWLLAQAKLISSANLIVLLRLWPVILIALGLELLIGRRSQALSLLIGVGTVILLLGLMLLGPALGLATNSEAKSLQYSEPLEGADSAQLDLNLSVGSVTVQALTDSNDLIDADMRYIGDVNFDVSSAGSEKYVTLTTSNENGGFYNFLGFTIGDELRLDIALTPLIPLDLRLNGGVGETRLDLSDLQLSSLNIQGGVGETTISLPNGGYAFLLDGGVGATTVNFAETGAVTATITGGIGGVTLNIPDGLPVRLESDGGLGGVNVSGDFEQISSDGDNGVWETANFREASDDARLIIELDGGVGGVNVR